MARPRSEDKPIALLDAATELVATQGLGASTSAIARQAGVAEGTLFRYFPSKDALLNALYLYHCRTANEACLVDWEDGQPLKAGLERMWGHWIDWALTNPAAFGAMVQLEVSDKLTPESLAEAWTLCGNANQVFDAVRYAGIPKKHARDLFNRLSTATAQATVQFIAAHPEQAAAAKRAAFAMVWAGLQTD